MPIKGGKMLESCTFFRFLGKPISCEPYGSGHINRTYLVKTDASLDYIMQKINSRVFRDVPGLMANIHAVTSHLRKKEPEPRRVLTLIKTHEGGVFHRDHEGGFWRVYDFITDSLCLDKPETLEDFRQSAVAFGNFQNMLADFPADTLSETIPRFHDTPDRYAKLHAAIKADSVGRLHEVRTEIDFALAREEEAGLMMAMLRRGELPLRVTHNDTKLNNVMLDKDTREALCVIDLDTVMPGLAANDFGDSIRFGASTAAEDERDLDLVRFSLPAYEAYTQGFLEACGKRLAENEISTLPMGAKLMTLECGIRFLTDYLSGDVYFATHRPGHNLDRCRTQFKLVADMEAQWDEMAKVVEKCRKLY
jgi:thiamine kinase-like enzyme